jgi:hypothetical protein
MANKKEIVLRKIPLGVLLDVLKNAWDKGADFIDIIGVPNEVQDNIAIAIKDEYMSSEDAPKDGDYEIEVDLDEDDDEDKLDDINLDELI